MKIVMVINVEMPTNVGISTFMSRKHNILDLSEPDKYFISGYFYTYGHLKFHEESSVKKVL